MGQVTTGPVEYPYEKEKREAENPWQTKEQEEEPAHEPVEGVDSQPELFK